MGYQHFLEQQGLLIPVVVVLVNFHFIHSSTSIKTGFTQSHKGTRKANICAQFLAKFSIDHFQSCHVNGTYF